MKLKIIIDKTDTGVTIWVNGIWVLDASLFNSEMKFSVDKRRMKLVKNYKFKNHLRFKYDKRTR